MRFLLFYLLQIIDVVLSQQQKKINVTANLTPLKHNRRLTPAYSCYITGLIPVRLQLRPGSRIQSSHSKGNETTSSLHTVAIILVMLWSPTTVSPTVTVALENQREYLENQGSVGGLLCC